MSGQRQVARNDGSLHTDGLDRRGAGRPRNGKGASRTQDSLRRTRSRRRSGRKLVSRRVRDRAHHFLPEDDGIRRLSDAGALSRFSEPGADAGVSARLCGEIRAAETHPVEYQSGDGASAGGRKVGVGTGDRREAHLQRTDRLQRASLGQAFSELSGKIRRPVDSFERLPESGAVGGETGSGDRRRKLRVRYCGGGGARGKDLALERAQRLLVSAEDVFRDSFGGDDEAVVPGVGAAADDRVAGAHYGGEIQPVRLSRAGPQNF